MASGSCVAETMVEQSADHMVYSSEQLMQLLREQSSCAQSLEAALREQTAQLCTAAEQVVAAEQQAATTEQQIAAAEQTAANAAAEQAVLAAERAALQARIPMDYRTDGPAPRTYLPKVPKPDFYKGERDEVVLRQWQHQIIQNVDLQSIPEAHQVA